MNTPTIIVVYFRNWGDGRSFIRTFDYSEDFSATDIALMDGDYVQFF